MSLPGSFLGGSYILTFLRETDFTEQIRVTYGPGFSWEWPFLQKVTLCPEVTFLPSALDVGINTVQPSGHNSGTGPAV